MKLKLMAARRAAFLSTLVLALIFMSIPLVGNAKSGSSFGYEKSKLVTVEDFIQHAASQEVDIHELYFELRPYEGTVTCLMCHESEGNEMLQTGHFKWAGKVANIAGLEGQDFGKKDLINNFCIATDSNEGRCTQCHVGYGYKDSTYDFNNPLNVDCLACHDQTGTYKKAPTTAGLPDPNVNLQAVAASIRMGVEPTRKACVTCHAFAGGGDNVKHGDISSDMSNTTREYDVHMGTDGGDLSCVACHGANHDPKTGEVNHGIAGMALHSVNEGEMKQCNDCHGKVERIHAGSSVEPMMVEGWHDNLACQVCHIPAIARAISTKVEWYWSDAGKTVSPIPVDPVTGRETYNKKKGTFVWSYDVMPTLRYSNGTWNRKVIGANDKYDAVPIDLGSPQGNYADGKSMIYPFKMMKGDQAVDTVNKTLVIPHLFGTAGGPNPYWGKFNWELALYDGAAYTGQEFSGTYGFEPTTMLLTVNHEVAPKEDALGYDSDCGDCHASDRVDWPALDWTDDPFDGGVRVPPTENAVLTWRPPLQLDISVE